MSSVEAIVDRLVRGDASAWKELTPQEKAYARRILGELKKTGHSDTAEALVRLDYHHPPVDINQFLEDDYYLGKVGRDVYPVWREHLSVIFDPARRIMEAIFGGAIGTGKSRISAICLHYLVYQLAEMVNPNRYYGHVEGSPIVFGFFNVFQYLAHDTTWQYFSSQVSLSPFFMERCKPPPKNPRLYELPNNIKIAIGAEAISALGQNIFGGILSEVNFKEQGVTEDERSKIDDLYMAVRDRMESRFQNQAGVTPGLLILDSSARDESDFLERHLEKVENDPHTYVVRLSRWDAKPGRKGEPVFKIMMGDRLTAPRILEGSEKPPVGMEVCGVPERFRTRFMLDLPSAIRDILGRPTRGLDHFFPDPSIFQACLERSVPREHPFSVETPEIGLKFERMLEEYLVKDRLVRMTSEADKRYAPIYHPQVGRYIHVDLSKNWDYTGIGCGCCPGVRRVERIDDDGVIHKLSAPLLHVDFVLQVKTRLGDQIDFSKIISLVVYLRRLGFAILGVSYDSWQSVGELQRLEKQGFQVKTVSVDKTSEPYRTLRSAFQETRVDYYDYPLVVYQMSYLRMDPRTGKVDHPIKFPTGEKGRKDVSDTLAAVAFRCLNEAYSADHVVPVHSGMKEEVTRVDFEQRQIERLVGKSPGPNVLDALFDKEGER